MTKHALLSLVGDTPLVEITKLNPYKENVRIFAKLECVNPGGSIKARVALEMIETAEKSGELTKDKIIIEATSGNTGIGLAMVAAVKGYRMMLLMPETASEERKMIMRAYGAEIFLTPGNLATDGAIEEAYRLAREEPEKYVLLDQYNNPASVEAHYHGTGKEIWDQTNGEVTHAVACLGTTGTIMGLAKRLKEEGEKAGREVYVGGIEPNAGHKIQGLKNMHESYPPGIYNKRELDEVFNVEDEESFDLCRRLAREEGLFVGMSSGAALAGALKVASTLESGTVVTIFPDGGERYLSTPLFVPPSTRGISLHNVANGKKTYLSEDKNKHGLFTPGPSLDEPDRINPWRRIVLLDVLGRYMASQGLEVMPCAAIADLDDRTLQGARDNNQSRSEFSTEAMKKITSVAAELGISDETLFPAASDSVERSLKVCRKLLAKGMAYEKLRSVYFDVFRDKRYGDMGSMDIDKLSVGKTVDLAAYVKDNPLDFTLFKRASLLDLKLGDIVETEWGNVRPTWFMQLASAGMDTLPRVDVCLVSEQHQFPHMENLRALFGAEGMEPSIWMVDQHVGQQVNGESITLASLKDKFESPRALRMWLLSCAYRKGLTVTEENMRMWSRNWKHVQEAAAVLAFVADTGGGKESYSVAEDAEQAVFDLQAAFTQALENDLGLHHFWPALSRFGKHVHRWTNEKALSSAVAADCLKQLMAVDEVLGIIDTRKLPIPRKRLNDDVMELVFKRDEARRNKDFATSDKLRAEVEQMGYRLEDSSLGTMIFSAECIE
ncbi:MAG: cysteine synthase [Desulfovibrio sp.]